MLASTQIGPVQFEQPIWLVLVPVAWAMAVWMARSSLSGLGTTTRRVALVVRLVVIALLVGAVARPQWRKESKTVSVIVIQDQSESIPVEMRQLSEQYIQDASRFVKDPGDTVGRVTVARESYVQALPGRPGDRPDSQNIGATDGTNLAEGTTLGMAIARQDSATRLVIISDFNQTNGDVVGAANAAIAAHIPIDVLPIRYKYAREVIVERLVSPATARMGENVNLRVLINSTKPASGRLDITMNGQPMDLDPDSPEMGIHVELKEGSNAIAVPITLPRPGPQSFEAIFTPDDEAMDKIKENNRSRSVTFVTSEGRVLVLTPNPDEATALVKVMTESRLAADVRDPDSAPKSLIELSAYDLIVMMNTPAYPFTQQQQEDLRAYVHDIGGGLVMTGGPDAFGAGGWIGSPTADALPIKLDPPEKRQMPRGCLAMIMHSCEMPQGNFWGKEVCLEAIEPLSRLDLAGVMEFSWRGGETWIHPISELGNKAAIRRAINSLSFGDAPSFEGFLLKAIAALEKAEAGQKHVIIVSDGDPSPPSRTTLQRYIDAKISISCVCVFPHGGDPAVMQNMASATGGKYHRITDDAGMAELPKIIFKEAQTVKRALIWEGTGFSPHIVGGTEAMRGINGVPPITGYVVAAEREGLSQVVMTGQENDPILAQWQYGLGKAVTYTSDASKRWTEAWVGWGQFRAFWEQHIRWAMRPSGSAEIRVTTEDQGEKTRIVVEALDAKGERLSFLRWRGAAVGPDGKSQPITLRQFGPGQYEAELDTARSGAYMMNFRYDGPLDDKGESKSGSVQAAVTRPFADEFRALQDNAALATQVAKLTGGRVLSDDPRIADLWTRDGLKMPVATRPIWLAVAIAAIGLFLMDVAVRRVRIDLFAMAASARRGFRKGTMVAGQQMGSLREARERARESMAARSSRKGEGADGEGADGTAGPAPITAVDKAVRSVKFEASESELAAARKRPSAAVVDVADLAGEASRREEKAPKPVPTAEEGMSRLLKAKKRAQDEMTQD
jgi:uncharacterized membrane protein